MMDWQRLYKMEIKFKKMIFCSNTEMTTKIKFSITFSSKYRNDNKN